MNNPNLTIFFTAEKKGMLPAQLPVWPVGQGVTAPPGTVHFSSLEYYEEKLYAFSLMNLDIKILTTNLQNQIPQGVKKITHCNYLF